MKVDRSLVIGSFKSAEQMNQCRDVLRALGEDTSAGSYDKGYFGLWNLCCKGSSHFWSGDGSKEPNITPEEFLARYSEPKRKKTVFKTGDLVRVVNKESPWAGSERRIFDISHKGDTGTGKLGLYIDLDDMEPEWVLPSEVILLEEAGAKKLEYIEPPKKLSGFINVYPHNENIGFVVVRSHETRSIADSCSTPDRVACIDLSQFHEGHGLAISAILKEG